MANTINRSDRGSQPVFASQPARVIGPRATAALSEPPLPAKSKDRPRVLLVEDNPDDAHLLRKTLKDSAFDVEWVDRLSLGMERLKTGGIDVLLLDLTLPDSRGLETVTSVHAHAPGIPIVVITGLEDETLAMRVVAEGAQDYLSKGRINREIVVHTVQSAIERNRVALLDMARDAVIVRDMTDRILYWNQSATRLYGWTAAEALTKKAGDLLQEHPDVETEEARKTAVGKAGWTGELRQKTKDGTPILVESRWTLVRDEKGHSKAKLTVSTDITERKKFEAEFLRMQRIEGIGKLAAGIAHDMNNALAPILIAVDMLAHKHPDSSSQMLLSVVRTSAERGAEMVKQIMSFANVSKGGPVLFQPRIVLQEIETMLYHTLPKSIELSVVVSGDLWPVTGDPTQLYQVLLNLCVNSRDAMPHGGKLAITATNVVLDEVYAYTHPEATADAYVLLTVADTGAGIPPVVLQNIFDPFFTTKPTGQGIGLGLSTVIGIVKSHGGFIDVCSDVGRGTEFRVYLPATESSATREARDQSPDLPCGHGELLLIVDDELALCEITKQVLENYGYRVVAAHDGAEGVAAYVRHKDEIQAVLTDMLMPVMDGFAMIRALRKLNPQVRILAATGGEAGANGLKEVVQGFLSKPYSADALLKAVREILGSANDTWVI